MARGTIGWGLRAFCRSDSPVMTQSTRRNERLRSTALLLLALAITTGWTQAAAPIERHGPSDSIAMQRAGAIAIGHGAATVRPRAAIAARAALAGSRAADLARHRASEAALVTSARALYQAHITASRVTVPAPAKAQAKAKAKAPIIKAKAPSAKAPSAKAPTNRYSGTNHFWFPVLGMSRSVNTFACSRSREPGNYVYRWGCAGRDNVYLLGHAWGVFKPLHDAYLAGRLRVGMVAYYADANGRVRKYRVTTWRVVDPTNSSWAIASQSVPSMTLQTCVGLKRLNVRLVAVN